MNQGNAKTVARRAGSLTDTLESRRWIRIMSRCSFGYGAFGKCRLDSPLASRGTSANAAPRGIRLSYGPAMGFSACLQSRSRVSGRPPAILLPVSMHRRAAGNARQLSTPPILWAPSSSRLIGSLNSPRHPFICHWRIRAARSIHRRTNCPVMRLASDGRQTARPALPRWQMAALASAGRDRA